VECSVQHRNGVVEFAEFIGGAEQVRISIPKGETMGCVANRCVSSSPLNGQAAELWDKDPEEYKRLVLARHKTPEELDA
jgi:hypothetical protein